MSSATHIAAEPAPAVESGAGDSRLTGVVSGSLAGLTALLAASLGAAMLGLHHAVVVVPAAALGAIGLYRTMPRAGAIERLSRPLSVALTLLIVVVVLSNFSLRSETVITGRDGGTYAATAAFLVEGDDLFPEAVEEPFIGQDLDYLAPGFVVRPDGTFWQQFLHATPATYAVFGELFGMSAIFGINAFISGIGVLALFALGRRFMSGWWALLACALIAGSLPFAYYARGSMSEMASLTLAAGGVWAAHVALSGHPRVSLGAGLLLGATAMVRVDMWMIGISLALLAFTTTWFREEQAAWVATRLFTGFFIAAAIGLIDLTFFAEPYLANVGKLLLALIVVAVVVRAAVPAAATAGMRRLAELVQRHSAALGAAVGAMFIAFVAYRWFIRPLLGPITGGGAYDLEAIQIAEGNPVEPGRNYRELSVWWLAWYLGIPVLIAGFVAMAGGLRRSIARGQASLRMAILILIVPLLTYIIRPSINPDQIWAIRRFLPVVIPGVTIAAVALAALGWSKLARGSRARTLTVGLVAVATLPLLLTSARLIGEPDRSGVAEQFAGLCDSLSDSESVLVVNNDNELPLTWLIGPPLRAWCGVSVAGVSPSRASELTADAIIATSPDALPAAPTVQHELSAKVWESRLTAPPQATELRRVDLYIVLAD